jgi:16S rRNA (guanine527-N7)-methyltransferase
MLWVDFGSGAGFPGLVIAAIASEKRENMTITLIESDERKCIFLSEVSRILGLKVNILNDRIENVPVQNADIVSARAVASLEKLMVYSRMHRKKIGRSLFMRGKNAKQELLNLKKFEGCNFKVFPSYFETDGFILQVGNEVDG